MHMLTERLQILISPQQRRRLEDEAARRGTSVASVIREAVDVQLGSVPNEQRQRAVESLRARPVAPRTFTPDELDAMIEVERNAAAARLRSGA
jgi:hypothetical protein